VYRSLRDIPLKNGRGEILPNVQRRVSKINISVGGLKIQFSVGRNPNVWRGLIKKS